MDNKEYVLTHYPNADLSKGPVVGEFRLQLWPFASSPVFMAESEAGAWRDAALWTNGAMYILSTLEGEE